MSKVETKDKNLKDLKEAAGKTAHFLEKLAYPLGEVLTFVLPRFIFLCKWLYSQYCKLPQNAVKFIIGSGFCFFGGLYPVLFAAVQAAEYSGRQVLMQAISVMANQTMIIIEESKKDDEKDEDGDGIADVKQISGNEYMKRKTLLVLAKMDPQKIDDAYYACYKVWLSVAAVLKVKFARTVALSLAIADFLKRPCDKLIAPVLKLAIPDKYDKWVPVVLGWICKSFAMSIAWYLQSVLSAFSSALAGGLMMATSFYNALILREVTLRGRLSKDGTKSFFIDVFSMVFAGLGFYFQYKIDFDMPFPWNWILWPAEVAEYYLRWSITN